LFCDQGVDHLWVAFASGGFEDLADEEAHEFGVACFELRDVFGVVGDHVVDEVVARIERAMDTIG
jgi:hypothetical protein